MLQKPLEEKGKLEVASHIETLIHELTEQLEKAETGNKEISEKERKGMKEELGKC